ncbi:DUF4374 domain-containing protein [Fulvivirga sp. RKSG066]|uniref:DUF4374 domain-containing protein n=1 Tax=Fulvivirga aurantia TaxID=2529383 RepID=UPI0012BC4E9A|nr:DUF4374 domain-containing protein [Fulvivirga aurantia]MTI21580.1 DUF4374 domain-containing protein [Fulvivirga aurantia]
MRNTYLFSLLISAAMLFVACSDDEPTIAQTDYFVGVEAATDPATDVLTPATSLDEGIVSPVGNGFEQPAWMSFLQGKDKIIVTGYTSAPEFVSYEHVEGQLTKGQSFFTDLGTYAYDFVDQSTMIIVGSAREGLSDKKIYVVNTNSMAIEKTVSSDFGNDEENNLLAFPVDAKVRGNKLFIAYYHISAEGDFSTPMANQAEVAVFSYPEIKLEKIIKDDRAPNIGRYYTANALEIAENGDIYTFSPSSLACGYAPVPATNSGVLRIKNGETAFDPSFHIDFEAISGGYKINDLYYVANGKAVVRVLKEDETNGDFLWATYAPTSETPLLETGILDLNTGSFTMLNDVPRSGGGWASTTLVEGSKLYLGVNNSEYAGIYIIDVTNGTATEGATIDGNYAKAILSLTE